jgi:hypothetical protein
VRFVPLRDWRPAPQWLEKAGKLLDRLKAAPDRAARKKIVDRNGRTWGELKDELLGLSHGKCWFSEARDCCNYWHVEHFRPKSSVLDLDGTEHDGYWWLAFEWHNYRICGSVNNTAKSTHFPLRAPARRALTPADDIRGEDPILLDPADEGDPILLSFDLEGTAVVASHVSEEWERQRADYSIGRLNLNFPYLAARRKTVWQECWRLIEAYRAELRHLQLSDGGNALARQGAKHNAAAIRGMLRSEAEFSATARACILWSGDKRLASLLQTM